MFEEGLAALPAHCLRPSQGFQASEGFGRTKVDTVTQPPPDLVAAAHREGYDSGYEAGKLLHEKDAAIGEVLQFRLGQIDRALEEQMTERLREFALEICMATLEPLAIDPQVLDRRIGRALSMLSRASDQPRLFANPHDMALVKGHVPDDIPVLADPSLGRGDIRLEAAHGGVEDGPDSWRRAIGEALQI